MIRGVAEASRAELEADESPNRISAVQAAGIDTMGGAVPGSVGYRRRSGGVGARSSAGLASLVTIRRARSLSLRL